MTEPLGTYGQTVGQTATDPETGEIFSPSEGTPLQLSVAARRARKYDRARVMARLLGHKDLAGCHAWARSLHEPVTVNAKLGVPRSGFFTNVQTCGLVHLCAHCQPKIAARRALEVKQAIDAHQAQGGQVVMVTLTLSHGRNDPLRSTLTALKLAGVKLAQHRAFKDLKASAGLVGRIVATEYTHGANGWHPHQHQLWFIRSGVSQDEMRDTLTPAWIASLKAAGFSASELRGVVVNGGEQAAQYVAKMATAGDWGLADEVVRASSKSGRGGSRSIWQMVDTLTDPQASHEARQLAEVLLREFASVVKGSKALTWSPGLKKRFLVVEVDDATLAEEAQEDDTYPLAHIEPTAWPVLVKFRVQAHVLTIAEDFGQIAVDALVSGLLRSVSEHLEVSDERI